jgi:hypothetical protein
MSKTGHRDRAVLAVAVALCAAPVRAAEDSLKTELEIVAQRRILFGHQSVGDNILEGLRQLAATHGVSIQVGDASSTSGGGAFLIHARVAENGNPMLKFRSFAGALAAVPGAPPDIALVKLCYADFEQDTDAALVFAKYQQTISELKTKYPATTFVHATVPLTTVQRGLQGGLKAIVKRLLGRAPQGFLQNIRREEYNAQLRRAYGGREPLLDLSEIESTRADGTTETASWSGRLVPELVGAYASDDGHLNREGQLRAARGLVKALAFASRPRPTDARQ